MMPLAALILAAGSSRRMGNNFKPLLPFGDRTVLEHLVKTYRSAGIDDIRVVCGFKAESVKTAVIKHNIRIIENPFYRSGMLSSVKAGIRSLEEKKTGFFIHPVDIPLVRPETIRKLAAVFNNGSCDVVHPLFMGKRGHPPLISNRFRYNILAWEGEGGLRGAMSNFKGQEEDIPVCDEGIHYDMDTPEEYYLMSSRLEELDIPSLKECYMAMDGIFDVSDDIKKHSRAVAAAALIFANEAEKKGCRLNKHMIITSALLHDIVRKRKHHDKTGAEVLNSMGFCRIADIVSHHMDYRVDQPATIDETSLVFLADKLIQQDRPVDLVERFQEKIKAYPDAPEIHKAIRERLSRAITVKRKLEALLGITADELLKQHRHLFREEISHDFFNAAW